MGRAIDLFVTYRFIKLLVTPFKDTDAFKLGIIDANGNRIITDDQSLQARTLFDELEAEYLERMSPGQAAAQAGRDTFDALKQIALEKKRKKLLQVQAFKNIDKNLREYHIVG